MTRAASTRLKLSLTAVILTGSALSGAMPALAGFEWIAPKVVTPKQEERMPAVNPPEVDRTELDPLPPLSIDQDGGKAATVYRPAPDNAGATPQSLIRTHRISPPSEEPGYQILHQPASAVSAPAQPQVQHLKMSDKLDIPEGFAGAQPQKLILPPETAKPPQPSGAMQTLAIDPQPLQRQQGWAAQAPAAPAAPEIKTVSQPRTMIVPPAAEAAVAEDLAAGNVVGFGSDIPLVMALQQVVPPAYTYAFGRGVNPAASVSWNGGKPWFEVLNDMLSANGMHALVKAKIVHIQSGSQAMSAGEAAPAIAEMQPAAGTPADEESRADQPAPLEEADKVSVSEQAPFAQAPEEIQQEETLEILSEINPDLSIGQTRVTTQVAGSAEESAQAKASVMQRALMEVAPDIAPAAGAPVMEQEGVKITSYTVTRKTQQPVVAGPRRASVTDPGLTESRQPQDAALNAVGKAPQEISKERMALIEAAARQQGVELSGKTLNTKQLPR